MTTHKICSLCGSENVVLDAYAEWNSEQGAWVLRSVYEESHCEACDSSTDILTIDEETQLEIRMFGMVADEDGFRLVVEGETPAHYDLMVSTYYNDAILALHEIDELPKEAAYMEFARLETMYPLASVETPVGSK
jgi:hypothetical protein